ncbi:MAG: MBL fold metallo-hydrolase [Oligoflexales bacterium]
MTNNFKIYFLLGILGLWSLGCGNLFQSDTDLRERVKREPVIEKKSSNASVDDKTNQEDADKLNSDLEGNENSEESTDEVNQKLDPQKNTENVDPQDLDETESSPENKQDDKNSEEMQVEPPSSFLDPGVLPTQWNHGTDPCSADQNPEIQVHEYNSNFFILRQNKCRNFEAPFMYLIFGKEKVLLHDTGALRNSELLTLVNATIDKWKLDNNIANISLLITHSHGHGDHIAGDSLFADRVETELVAANVTALSNFFNITNWPEQVVNFDLGDRVLDLIPIPGHQEAHIALYDRKTGVLLTGDTLYPGRLYINDWAVYGNSISRLYEFMKLQKTSYVMGAHIEMSSTPGQDYPIRTTFQPREHLLELKLETLKELDDALKLIGNTPKREVHNSFIISP